MEKNTTTSSTAFIDDIYDLTDRNVRLHAGSLTASMSNLPTSQLVRDVHRRAQQPLADLAEIWMNKNLALLNINWEQSWDACSQVVHAQPSVASSPKDTGASSLSFHRRVGKMHQQQLQRLVRPINQFAIQDDSAAMLQLRTQLRKALYWRDVPGRLVYLTAGSSIQWLDHAINTYFLTARPVYRGKKPRDVQQVQRALREGRLYSFIAEKIAHQLPTGIAYGQEGKAFLRAFYSLNAGVTTSYMHAFSEVFPGTMELIYDIQLRRAGDCCIDYAADEVLALDGTGDLCGEDGYYSSQSSSFIQILHFKYRSWMRRHIGAQLLDRLGSAAFLTTFDQGILCRKENLSVVRDCVYDNYFDLFGRVPRLQQEILPNSYWQ